MAEGSATVHVPVRLDTRKAERELSAFVKKAESAKVNLKGIDSRKFTQPLGRITGSVTEFNKSLEASNARVIAFGASDGDGWAPPPPAQGRWPEWSVDGGATVRVREPGGG